MKAQQAIDKLRKHMDRLKVLMKISELRDHEMYSQCFMDIQEKGINTTEEWMVHLGIEEVFCGI